MYYKGLKLPRRKTIEAKCDLSWCKGRLKEIGKVQTDLAQHLGISDGAANQFFWGNRYIKIDEVETFARFFEMNPADFLRRCGLNLVGTQGAIDQDTLSGVIENANDIFDSYNAQLSSNQKARIITRVYEYMLEEDSQQFDTSLMQKQIKSLLIFSMRDQN